MAARAAQTHESTPGGEASRADGARSSAAHGARQRAAGAAQELGGAHARAALLLQLEDIDPARAGGESKASAAGRRQRAGSGGGSPDARPLAEQLRLRADVRREGAHLVHDLLGRTRPVDHLVVAADLGGIGRRALLRTPLRVPAASAARTPRTPPTATGASAS